MTKPRNTWLKATAGITGLAAAAAFTIGATAVSAAEWDLPLAWGDGNFHVKNARVFAEEVKKATEGRVTINIHPGGSLGFKGPEMLTAVRDGLVPIGDILLNQQVGEASIIGIEAQPYIVKSFDELLILHKHFRPILSEVAKKFNQKTLYMVPWPRQYVYTKVPIKQLDDLKGIKIRTYDKTTTGLFNAVGMTAVQLPWGEVVPSLAAGTIDAVTTSSSSGVDGKFWEFLNFMYPTSHVWGSNMVNVNLDAWAALDARDRAAIEATAKRLEPQFWDVSRNEDVAKSKILNDRGVAMGTVTAEMLSGMQNATKPMIEKFVADNAQAKPVYDAYFKEVGR